MGNHDFGQRLRLLRQSRGLTQPQLAAMIRVRRCRTTASYICRLEHGKLDPRLSTILSIARALHVRPWYLLADLTENPEFWDKYLSLPPEKKRQVQRVVHGMVRQD